MSDYGHRMTDEEIAKMERRIKREYRQAADEAQKKLEKYMKDFERKDKAKQLAVKKGDISQSEYIEWRKNQILVEGRWREMQRQLAADYVRAEKISQAIINDGTLDIFALNHGYGTFDIETISGVDTSYTLYSRETVKKLVKENPKLLPQPRISIPKAERWCEEHLTSAMLQGIVQGESIQKIAKRLPRAVGEETAAGTIRRARTMATAAQNIGRQSAYERAVSLGIEMQKQWLATLDDRTRHEHRELDGQTVNVDEYFTVADYKLMEPGDPNADPEMVYNCRCTMVAQVKGHERSAEDLERRDTSHMEQDSYEEWKRAKDRNKKE